MIPFAIFLSLLSASNPSIHSTEALVTAMHERYHNNCNKNITFIQKNIEYKENGQKEVSVMYEAHHYPGHYRIDYGYVPNKDGYIFSNDSLYHFKDGKLVDTHSGEHDIILLTGDIFYIKPEKTIDKLQQSGFNTAYFRTDTLEGKKVYVVGSAHKKDTLSTQFWIDMENLYLVRHIKRNEAGTVEDSRFVEHEKVGDSWVEDRVIIYAHGRKIREEIYTEVKPNNTLEPDLFNPKYWGKLHWHKK